MLQLDMKHGCLWEYQPCFFWPRQIEFTEEAKNLGKRLEASSVFAIPSIIFIGFWLLYCFLGKGDPLYFRHKPLPSFFGTIRSFTII